MQVTKIAIEKIIPYEKNVKRHSEQQIEKIAKSIENVGFVQPLVVDEDNVIIIWHGRFEAMKFLGKKEVDCVVLKGLPEEKKRALRIGDNKLNESPYDMSNLKDEVQALFDLWFDLEELGFSLWELENFNLKIEDLEPQIPDEENFIANEYEQVKDENQWLNNEGFQGEKTAYQFSEVQWNQNLKHPLTFYLDNEEWNFYGEFFKTQRKREYNVPLLKEIVQFYLDNHNEQWES